MDEYIKRSACVSILRAKANMAVLMDAAPYFEKAAQMLEKLPAADVAPVRHAMWEVVVGSDGKEHMVCTGCRKQQDLTGVFSYCPNCGCRMDGGDDE